MKNETRSVARRLSRFTVAPSPFNPVKLELAVILLAGILLLLVQEQFIASSLLRLLLPLLYGIAGMGWLMLRTHRIITAQLAAQQAQHDGTH